MAPAGRTRLDGHASTLINPLLPPPTHPPPMKWSSAATPRMSWLEQWFARGCEYCECPAVTVIVDKSKSPSGREPNNSAARQWVTHCPRYNG